MTQKELYAALNDRIPQELSCDWDNDGLMCCPVPEGEVKRVLVALDITAAVVEKAIREGYDTVISHHPLIFSPLKRIEPSDPIAKKVIALIGAGITAMSFHTRLDAVTGGVNDVLASALGLESVEPFGENGEAIGRIGYLPKKTSLYEFAKAVKDVTGADSVAYSDAGLYVHRVAVLGGGGASDVDAAHRAGADTYVTGELKHNNLTDAPERGMNLVAAGHFHTENLICDRIRELVLEINESFTVDVTNSNPVCVL